MPREWTIARLAAAAGVSVETIRYYERRGLLQQPQKPVRGFRRYPTGMAGRVRFIKRAQALGFKLSEIARLLDLDPGAAACCEKTRLLAKKTLAAIETRLDELRGIRDALDELVRRCEDDPAKAGCPIIDALSREDRSKSSATCRDS